ncbi:MAG TPA: hypothetical protein VGM03_23640 [Phycisphaerae bacterium]
MRRLRVVLGHSAIALTAGIAIILLAHALCGSIGEFAAMVLLIPVAGQAHEICWIFHGRRQQRARICELQSVDAPGAPLPAIRIRCRVAEMLEFMGLHDFGFEPLLFRSASRHLLFGPQTRAGLLVMLALLAAVVVISGRVRTRWWLMVFALIPLAGLLVWGLIRQPAYYRIIPGRVDTLDFSWKSEQAYDCRTVSLEGARLLIDMTSTERYITIFSGNLRGSFDTRDVYDPLGFALAIVQGAISTAQTPSVPADRLIG